MRYIKVIFGENGLRRETAFEKLTSVVVILMVLVTVGDLIATVIGPTI